MLLLHHLLRLLLLLLLQELLLQLEAQRTIIITIAWTVGFRLRLPEAARSGPRPVDWSLIRLHRLRFTSKVNKTNKFSLPFFALSKR